MSSCEVIQLTSSAVELLVSVSRDAKRRLGQQIEAQIRAAIHSGALGPGAILPSTRDLARQLGVSRPVVVDAYAQLAAEGYLSVRQGSRPRVSESAAPVRVYEAAARRPPRPPRYDFQPAIPDLASFPRNAWLRALRQAVGAMSHDTFGYAEPHGAAALRVALAAYLGRARGVVADPNQILVTSGFAQARVLVCRALGAQGVSRLAVEDPSYDEWDAVTSAGLEPVPVPVDDEGMRTDLLEGSRAQAAMVTPAHQFPTGVVMTGARRSALVTWLRATGSWAFEDDYDAEYRYDRSPVGALQAMAPDRVIYAGTASKTLAPALRLGWLVVPAPLLDRVRAEQRRADAGCPRIDQHALAAFIESGGLDRHLRRMRARYRTRRQALLTSLAAELPEAVIRGIDAGLHAAVELLDGDSEERIRAEAARRGIAFETVAVRCMAARRPPTLLLGYARSSEARIRAGVRELAAAVRASRGGEPTRVAREGTPTSGASAPGSSPPQ